MGGVASAKLAIYAKDALTPSFNDLTVRLWTDSQIVLH